MISTSILIIATILAPTTASDKSFIDSELGLISLISGIVVTLIIVVGLFYRYHRNRRHKKRKKEAKSRGYESDYTDSRTRSVDSRSSESISILSDHHEMYTNHGRDRESHSMF